MTFKILKADKVAPFKLPEDLIAVCREYTLGKINYVDIIRQDEFAQMMQHWPLFAELAKVQHNKE